MKKFESYNEQVSNYILIQVNLYMLYKNMLYNTQTQKNMCVI